MTWNEWLAIIALVISAIAFFVAVSALGAAERARKEDRAGTAEAPPSAATPKAAVPVLHLVDEEYSRLDRLDGLPRIGSSLEQDDR